MPQNHSGNHRLDSWKKIASYLDRDIRTVMRWEQEKELPVHRVPGGKRQAIFAYTDEIDAWLLGQTGKSDDSDSTSDSEGGNTQLTPLVTAPTPSPKSRSEHWPLIPRVNRRMLITGICLLALGWIAFAALVRSHTVAALHPFRLDRLTDDARQKAGIWSPRLRTDGTTLYFNETEGARQILVSAPMSGKPIRPIETTFPNVFLQDLSRDGKTLLITSFEGIVMDGPLWTLPVVGGVPRKVGEARCYLARWSRDNRRIVCTGKTTITVMDADGSNAHMVASFSKPVGQISWTPDGNRLRYVLEDTTTEALSLWEIGIGRDATVTQAKGIRLGSNCCIDWMWAHNGKDFIYTELEANGKSRLMVYADGSPLPVELPVNIGMVTGVASDPASDIIYLVIDNTYRDELLKFNVKQGTLENYHPGLSAEYLSFSRDGRWMSYADAGSPGSLWRSRIDGSERLQLSPPLMTVELSAWSPDGQRIAFMGRMPGKPWRIYLVDRDGRTIEEVSGGNDNQGGPSWSRDGKELVYGSILCDKTQDCWIHRVNLAARTTEIVPDSSGLRTARWSPDGNYIAALRFETHDLMLFDVHTTGWRVLAGSVTGDNINWSRDSRYVYVDSPREKRPVIERVRIRDGQRSTVVSLNMLQDVIGQIGP